MKKIGRDVKKITLARALNFMCAHILSCARRSFAQFVIIRHVSDTRKYNKLTDSLEDYIEVISYICRRKVSARVSDIAMYLGVKMSSVTRALQCLCEEELIHYSKYKSVVLTTKGNEYAAMVLEKHRLSYEFLHFILGIDAANADVGAHKMKKALNPVVMEKMKLFLNLHMRSTPHKHADCKHNEMRCMLCVLPSHAGEIDANA